MFFNRNILGKIFQFRKLFLNVHVSLEVKIITKIVFVGKMSFLSIKIKMQIVACGNLVYAYS